MKYARLWYLLFIFFIVNCGGANNENLEVVEESADHSIAVERISDKTISENSNLTIKLAVSDTDGDDLRFAVVGIPDFITLNDSDSENVSLTVNPGYEDAGTYVIKIIANDGLTSAYGDFILTVENDNRTPTIVKISDQTIVENSELTIDLLAGFTAHEK
jgi:Putative Ig domain